MNEQIKKKIEDLYSKIHKLSSSSPQRILIVKSKNTKAEDLVYLSPERTAFHQITTQTGGNNLYSWLAEAVKNNEWLFVELKNPILSMQLNSNINTLGTLNYAQNLTTDEQIRQSKQTVIVFILDEEVMRDQHLSQNFKDCFAPIIWLEEKVNV